MIGQNEPENQPQDGGLPGAGAAEDADRFSRIHIERDRIEDRQIPVVQRQVLQRDDRPGGPVVRFPPGQIEEPPGLVPLEAQMPRVPEGIARVAHSISNAMSSWVRK